MPIWMMLAKSSSRTRGADDRWGYADRGSLDRLLLYLEQPHDSRNDGSRARTLVAGVQSQHCPAGNRRASSRRRQRPCRRRIAEQPSRRRDAPALWRYGHRGRREPSRGDVCGLRYDAVAVAGAAEPNMAATVDDGCPDHSRHSDEVDVSARRSPNGKDPRRMRSVSAATD